MKRRTLILTTLALTACGGNGGTPVASNQETDWHISTLSMSIGQSIDLSSTLPAGVRRGGVFDVDPNGAPLPEGLHLSPEGVLSATRLVTAGGIVFRYVEP